MIPIRLEATPWMDDAACLDEPPALFFPEYRGDKGARQIKQARAICASCVVRGDCLDYALRHRIAYGIWGGRTEDERDELLKQRGMSRTPVRAATPLRHGTPSGYARGCRCAECRHVNAHYMRNYRERRAGGAGEPR